MYVLCNLKIFKYKIIINVLKNLYILNNHKSYLNPLHTKYLYFNVYYGNNLSRRCAKSAGVLSQISLWISNFKLMLITAEHSEECAICTDIALSKIFKMLQIGKLLKYVFKIWYQLLQISITVLNKLRWYLE